MKAPDARRLPRASRAICVAPASHMAEDREFAIGHRAMRALLHSGAIRAKLEVGASDDPLEREADQTADRVMRSPMAAGAACPACRGGDEDVVHRSSQGGAGTAHKPAGVDRSALGLGVGAGLPSSLRAFFEPRLGRDLDRVRIHTDAPAAAGARSIGARAFTLGADIAFADGHYRPDTPDGRHLIAHELAHVVQADGGQRIRRAPCRSTAQCGTAGTGDPAKFSDDADVQIAAAAAANAAAPAGTTAAARHARHGQLATNILTLMTMNGMLLRAEVFGIFINPDLDGQVGAQAPTCDSLSPRPAGAPPNQFCIEVPLGVEELAATLVPASPLDVLAAMAGRRPPETLAQRNDRLWILSKMQHEMEHARFGDNQAATITPTADCNINTVVRGAFTVEFFLSEIAAIANEFPVYFDNHIAHPDRPNHELLWDLERRQVFDTQEGILGAIKGLQCVCSCASVNDLVTQTVNLAMTDWTPAQRLAFLRAMSRMMPSFWPPALVRADRP